MLGLGPRPASEALELVLVDQLTVAGRRADLLADPGVMALPLTEAELVACELALQEASPSRQQCDTTDTRIQWGLPAHLE